MRRFATAFAFIFCLLFIIANVCSASGQVGVVLLHGKNGFPSNPPLPEFSQQLRKAGFLVAVPEMPYSRDRHYDKAYEDSLAEIDAAVSELKKNGAEKIVIAGHSLGANVALYYATTKTVDAVVAMAPGHTPERQGMRKRLASEVEKARSMIEKGQGDVMSLFDDMNQGRVSTVKTTPRIYLSWFDPDGSAIIPRSTSRLKQGTALLWVIGTKDPLIEAGTGYAFDKAPSDPRHKYLVVEAEHFTTPSKAAKQIIEWIEGL
jgi:dienelactone hydrolase